MAGVARHARRAQDRAAEDDDLTRASASALSGLASWGDGDLEAAERAYSACVEGLRRVGHVADVLGCSIALADIRLTQGRVNDALATYEWALQLAAGHPATAPPGTVLPGTADMYVGLSQVALERNDLDAATALLMSSQQLGERAGLPQNPYRWRVAMARLKEAQGNPPAALALLDEANGVYTGDFSPNVRPVPAMRARLLAAHGYEDEALAWAVDRNVSADDDLSYLREYEHVTLARILLARHTAAGAGDDLLAALALLARLLAAAEAGGRTGTAIEILVLQALAHQADGDTPRALAHLERALALAEPEGFVRLFAAEGSPMAVLLNTLAARPHGSPYVRRLAAACAQTAQSGTWSEPPVLGTARRESLARGAESSRARGPAVVVHGSGRSRYRTTPGRVAEHRAQPHQEHLHQARCQQPSSSRHARRRARRAASHLATLTPPVGRPVVESPCRPPHVGMSAHHPPS